MSDKKKNMAETDLSSRLDELAGASSGSKKTGGFLSGAGEALRAGLEKLRGGISTSRFRRGGAAAALTALFLVFVVLVNLVAVTLTDRYAVLSPDLTSNRIYTLSDTTMQLLRELDEHVEIDIIATEAMCKYADASIDPYGQIPMATELIERYAQNSSNIKIFYIDITQNPGFLDLIPQYRESVFDYSIVVRSEKRTRVTSFYQMLPSLSSTAYTDSTSIDTTGSMTEMYISSLIKTVTLDTVPAVAYLDCLGGGDYAVNLLNTLDLNGYDLYSSEDFAFGYEPIPDEVQMVIIAAPQYDLTAGQLDQLAQFLRNGGKYGRTLLVFTSPYMPEMPNLSALLQEWGMILKRQTVYEGDSSRVLPMQNPDMFYATYMDSEYIDDDLASHNTVVSGAMNIEIPYQLYGSIAVNGILSSSTAGLVSDFSEVFSADNYTAADGAVRYIMAQATQFSDGGAEGQLRSDVIVAPVTLCSDNFFGSSLVYSNFDLLMNICNQRCGLGGESLDIPSKELTASDFSINTNTIIVLTVLFSYAVPIVVAVIGVIVNVRRRRL